MMVLIEDSGWAELLPSIGMQTSAGINDGVAGISPEFLFFPFLPCSIGSQHLQLNIADMTALKRQHRSLCFLALRREAWDVILKPYMHS